MDASYLTEGPIAFTGDPTKPLRLSSVGSFLDEVNGISILPLQRARRLFKEAGRLKSEVSSSTKDEFSFVGKDSHERSPRADICKELHVL